MPGKLTVEVVTPTSFHSVEDVDHLFAPGLDGYFGILPHHIEAVFALRSGEVRLDMEEARERFAVSGGYCEVRENSVLLLVETAERPSEIDIERAEKSLNRAKERLKKRGPGLDYKRAVLAIERAQARLKLAGKE